MESGELREESEEREAASRQRRHGNLCRRLAKMMRNPNLMHWRKSRRALATAMVWVQNPLRLGKRSETQPNLVLLRRRPELYASRPPTAGDVLLLVEVSDTTVESDRRVKVPLYSRSDIPGAWLADLQQRTITVYLEPTPDGYRTARVFRRGERVGPTAFPDRTLAVSDFLPE